MIVCETILTVMRAGIEDAEITILFNGVSGSLIVNDISTVYP